MKDFEKRIIELCKTTNVEKILTITGIVLAIITLITDKYCGEGKESCGLIDKINAK